MDNIRIVPIKRMRQVHVDSLDGVRGIAILMVLLFHLKFYLPGPFPVDKIIAKVSELGWSGVDLFFVLSGFLITGILMDTRDASNYFVSFYARRVLRVFPVFYWTLLLLFVVIPHIPSIAPLLTPATGGLWYWLYLSNWPTSLDPSATPGVSHFWSLAVEEQFYMAWPFLVWKTRPKHLLIVTICVSILALILRLVWASHGWNPEWIYRNTLSRIDALAIGSCGAVIVRSPRMLATLLERTRYLLLAACAGAVAVVAVRVIARSASHTSGPMLWAGYSILALTSLCIVLFAAIEPPARGAFEALGSAVLRSRILRKFGRYSYGIYVYHVPLLLVVQKFLGARLQRMAAAYSGIPIVLALIALCFFIAMVSFELAEKRILRLKRFFEPREPIPIPPLSPESPVVRGSPA